MLNLNSWIYKRLSNRFTYQIIPNYLGGILIYFVTFYLLENVNIYSEWFNEIKKPTLEYRDIQKTIIEDKKHIDMYDIFNNNLHFKTRLNDQLSLFDDLSYEKIKQTIIEPISQNGLYLEEDAEKKIDNLSYEAIVFSGMIESEDILENAEELGIKIVEVTLEEGKNNVSEDNVTQAIEELCPFWPLC